MFGTVRKVGTGASRYKKSFFSEKNPENQITFSIIQKFLNFWYYYQNILKILKNPENS
jgi:hypothetical protein